MIIRSKAPFRIGLAGGGSDVSPYSELYGGAVLNAAISLFAKTTIIPTEENKVVFESADKEKRFVFDSEINLPLNGIFDLQIGVYNYIVQHFTKKPLSFKMITEMEVPTGSGLGTSSTLVVSVIGAFNQWLELNLTKEEIAKLAFQIERRDLKMAGGKQDQYAATFGGVNFLEFKNEQVSIQSIQLSEQLLNELQFNLILYYNNVKRESAQIIEEQMKNVLNEQTDAITATHAVKEAAFLMREALEREDLAEIGTILNNSWENKKKLAHGISTTLINDIYSSAIKAGASGGKISGAGGGGFMFFYVDSTKRQEVVQALDQFGGEVVHFQFVQNGLESWTIK